MTTQYYKNKVLIWDSNPVNEGVKIGLASQQNTKSVIEV